MVLESRVGICTDGRTLMQMSRSEIDQYLIIEESIVNLRQETP
jgi:hypothetical protein